MTPHQVIPGIPGPSATISPTDPASLMMVATWVITILTAAFPGLDLHAYLPAVAAGFSVIVTVVTIASKHYLSGKLVTAQTATAVGPVVVAPVATPSGGVDPVLLGELVSKAVEAFLHPPAAPVPPSP